MKATQKVIADGARDEIIFTTENSPVLYAGLYRVFKDGEYDAERFAIITRNANPYISDVHDRMPVIMYKNELV